MTYEDPDDLYNEAVLLLNKGDEGSMRTAIDMLHRLVEEDNHITSKRLLGFMYLDGRGVERNLIKAYELISAAAAVLDPIAMYVLGGMYEGGLGVDQDDNEALYMFIFAAEFGIPGAAQDADRLYARIAERRSRKLRSRPILNLDISDENIEAACCKEMLDAAIDGMIKVINTYKGPELMRKGEDDMEIVCEECPFCGKKARKVSSNKIY